MATNPSTSQSTGTSSASQRLRDYEATADAVYAPRAANRPDAPAPAGWLPVDVTRFQAHSPDFAAQLYTDGQGHYRIGMRGTDSLRDLTGAGVALQAGRWHAQMGDAIRFTGAAMEQIMRTQRYSFAQAREMLDCAGHSMGGSLCELSARFYGLRGANIDGPGVQVQTQLPQYTALRGQMRGLGLPLLADDHPWQPGDFLATAHTVFGEMGAHAQGAQVVRHQRLRDADALEEQRAQVSPFLRGLMGPASPSVGVRHLIDHPIGAIRRSALQLPEPAPERAGHGLER